MEWLAEFGKWFGIVVLALGGPTLYHHYVSQSASVRRTRRRLARSERRIRELREVTERFERLNVEQRSVEARQAALDTGDLERLAMLQQVCVGLGARADAERHAPGSTALERDVEALLDASAALGDEYTRSASLAHVLEIFVRAGLYEQARSHARWVTDATVRDRLSQDPHLAPLLRPQAPLPLLLQAGASASGAGDSPPPVPRSESAD